MTTRFAPSPTGLLHLGHAFAAQFAHELAVQHNGGFLLRFEDIDTTRVRDDYYAKIERDLSWLGLKWSGSPLRQAERLPVYKDFLEKLKSLGVVYPCFCTRREIEHEIGSIANAPQGPEGSLYPGTCRDLTTDQQEAAFSAGKAHSWRLHSVRAAELTGPLTFRDVLHGQVNVDSCLLGDVILARKDIATSYHLAVVVDDHFQEITDVTRGEDLLASTHVHRTLQSLLGFSEPRYHHHVLIRDQQGQRLAKRNHSLSIEAMRLKGASAEDLLRGFTKIMP